MKTEREKKTQTNDFAKLLDTWVFLTVTPLYTVPWSFARKYEVYVEFPPADF